MVAAGKVALVGAGPGHPGLFTERGRQLLGEADAIVFDRLVSPRILAHARPDATLIYAGKEAKCHTLPQRDIEELLIQLAERGLFVVRLKGGDPFVFGRGAEEAIRLEQRGIAWEVVPGISSAVAVPAFAGIPVTLRNAAPGFAVLTGHRADGTLGDVRGAANVHGSLVILMGVGQLAELAAELIAAGRASDTPAAAVEWGTRSRQRSVTGTLADLPAIARRAALSSPAVIVIGDVVRVQEQLRWFERLPRFGERILVAAGTNAEALSIAEHLESEGAETCIATLEQRWRPDWQQWAKLVEACATGTALGVLFRTSFAVRLFWQSLQVAKIDLRRLSQVRFAALDAGVAAELRRYGIEADFTSLGEVARAKVAAWWAEDVPQVDLSPALRAAIEAFGGPVRTFKGFTAPIFEDIAGVDALRYTWADVLRAWVRDGKPDAVHIVGDPDTLAPLYRDVVGETSIMAHTPAESLCLSGDRASPPYVLASEWRSNR